jgi:S23 ribosomal protein.
MVEVLEIQKGYAQSVEDLKVFQRAFRVSLEIHKATLNFPKIEQYALADQMRRASKSVCANLAEGYAKQSFSKAEFKRFIGMAIASADEMKIWLKYTEALGYADVSVWREEYEVIVKMLGKLRATVEGGKS